MNPNTARTTTNTIHELPPYVEVETHVVVPLTVVQF